MQNKKSYKAPQIELVELDNEIALALESAPPVGPSESRTDLPEYFNNSVLRAELT